MKKATKNISHLTIFLQCFKIGPFFTNALQNILIKMEKT